MKTLLSCAATASAQPRAAVVELFTSEGCSSCPPAERYIGELVERSDVLALTFHVDYWDDLGWRDRFALPASVQRQRNYAKALRLSTVYTPQVVIDGKQDFVGSDRPSIGRALSAGRDGVAVGIARVGPDILVDVGAQAASVPCDVMLVAYRRTAVAAIGRGENAGRTISEFNVVRDFRSLGRWDGQARQYRAPIDSLPGDATDVAVLVAQAGQAPIIGARTLALR
ncbi:MAG: DUF1223 domain-containing protein [Steroidobacterales bacterium]